MRLIAAFVLLLSALALAQAQTPPRPPGFGSIESYAVPAGSGGPNELDFCYRYSKRLWELARNQPKDAATQNKLKSVIREALGAQGAAEDSADIDKYFSGAYASISAMAASRFYNCGVRLKLPIAPPHRENAEHCFDALALPRYVADQKAAGKSESDALVELRAATPPKRHAAIEEAVKLIYRTSGDAGADQALRQVFFTCFAGATEKPAGKG